MIRSFTLCKVTSLNYYRTKFWTRRKDYRKGSACGDFALYAIPFRTMMSVIVHRFVVPCIDIQYFMFLAQALH